MPTTAPLTIPRRLVPAVMLLGCGGVPPEPAAGELERAGITDGGRLEPGARELVEIMTDPDLVVSVDVTTRDGSRLSTVWATGGRAVWGRPVEPDTFQLRPIEAITAPLLLAQLTGIGRRPEQPFTGSATVTVGAIDTALQWVGEDPETALGILMAAGTDEIWADRILIAHQHMRARWTVSSVSTRSTGGASVCETTVLDAGPAGYWRLTPAGDDGTTYTVISLLETMRLLRTCLPGIGP